MNRAKLPLENDWADVALTLAIDAPEGAPKIVFTTETRPDAMEQAVGICQEALQTPVGLVNEDAPSGRATTRIGLFHKGTKIGAVCTRPQEFANPEEEREVVAAVLFGSRDINFTAPPLDAKEIAYLMKASEGQTDAEIAEGLNLSLRAVKERKKRTLTDLKAASIAHAIAIAVATRQI